MILQDENKTMSVQEKRLNILIAEDEEYNYLFLSEILREYNINPARAYNGKMAIDICNTNPDIHLVLMDVRMPVMDGYEATKQIKRFRPNLPIIAQTAFAMESDRQQAINEGFDDYISKPIRTKELFDLIAKYAPQNCPLVKV